MESADRDLVQRARHGDRDAYGVLWQRHAERIGRFLATMTGDDHAADDLRQETMRLGLERLGQLRDADQFGSWLLAIAVNRCRQHLRGEVQRRATGGDDPDRHRDERRRSALSSLVRRESAELLALAIDRLPILLREAFVLFHIDGLPYREVAAITAASEGALQVRVHRARALLRQQLGDVVETSWLR